MREYKLPGKLEGRPGKKVSNSRFHSALIVRPKPWASEGGTSTTRRTRYRIRHGKVKNSCLLPALQTETDCSCLCTIRTKSDEIPDRQLHNVQERLCRAGFRPDYRRAIPRIEIPRRPLSNPAVEIFRAAEGSLRKRMLFGGNRFMQGVLDSRDMGKKKPKKAKKPSSKKKNSPQVTEVETTFPTSHIFWVAPTARNFLTGFGISEVEPTRPACAG
jgi:hypothetical protein